MTRVRVEEYTLIDQQGRRVVEVDEADRVVTVVAVDYQRRDLDDAARSYAALRGLQVVTSC